MKAGQLGLTVEQISRATVAATSSSRFTEPNYWLDKATGTAYQVQVEYPQFQMNSTDDIELIPVSDDPQIYLRDVARWSKRSTPGEYADSISNVSLRSPEIYMGKTWVQH